MRGQWIENYWEETVRVGRFLLNLLNRILAEGSQGFTHQKWRMRGLDQIIFGDQIIKVRGLFTNRLSRILAETGLGRPKTGQGPRSRTRQKKGLTGVWLRRVFVGHVNSTLQIEMLMSRGLQGHRASVSRCQEQIPDLPDPSSWRQFHAQPHNSLHSRTLFNFSIASPRNFSVCKIQKCAFLIYQAIKRKPPLNTMPREWFIYNPL